MRGMLATLMLCASAGAVAAGADGPQPVTPATHSLRIGSLELTALHDAQYVVPNDGKTFGVDATPDAVAAVLKTASAPTDRITLSVNALLVKTGDRRVLIDTGIGPSMKGALLADLARAGVKPEAITDVLITHSHGDHVGGLVGADGRSAFPKAAIRMSTAEWTYFQKNGPAPLVQAISAQVRPFTPGTAAAPAQPLAPGITPVALDGHTPGHSGYELASNGRSLLVIGDLAHSAIVSLAHPEWTIAFDGDAATAKRTRRAELARLAKSGELVYAPHFPFPGFGRVVAKGDGYAWSAMR